MQYFPLVIDVVPQERRRIVNPQRGKCSSTGMNKRSKPQREGEVGIPEKESPGITGPKGDLIWYQVNF